MAIPDYFARNAVAIAQAISGLDEDRLSGALDKVRVGVTLGRDSEHIEGRALTDLLVRLLARLYPTLIFRAESKSAAAESARDLARRINPHVTLEGKPTIELVVGSTRLRSWASQRLYAGSTGWTATFSDNKPQSCGNSNIPFGAGVAACLAAANLFRRVFLPESALDTDVTFDTMDHNRAAGSSIPTAKMSTDLVLAGCGAIGNAAVWALSRAPMSGKITLVDHQSIDLGNLQRYVLADRVDEGSAKPAVAARFFIGALKAIPVEQDLASFLETNGHRIDHLLLALDSAQDRRAAQASLPRWITNAWSQPGDLGISTHDFLNGACVSCLYLPERALMNEDAI